MKRLSFSTTHDKDERWQHCFQSDKLIRVKFGASTMICEQIMLCQMKGEEREKQKQSMRSIWQFSELYGNFIQSISMLKMAWIGSPVHHVRIPSTSIETEVFTVVALRVHNPNDDRLSHNKRFDCDQNHRHRSLETMMLIAFRFRIQS